MQEMKVYRYVMRATNIHTKMKTYQQELREKYPVTMNNGARIIQSKIDKMQDHPSESRGQEIEAMSGIPFDYESADAGNWPELKDN